MKNAFCVLTVWYSFYSTGRSIDYLYWRSGVAPSGVTCMHMHSWELREARRVLGALSYEYLVLVLWYSISIQLICIQIYSESPTGTWYCSFLVVRDVSLCRNWYDATVVHGTTRLLVHTCKRWWPYQMTCNLNSIVCRRAQSDMHQHSIVPIPDGVTSGITVFYHTSTRTLYQVLLVLY